MKILVVCMRNAYGNPSRELSYEYFNFFQVLAENGHEVDLYDYGTEIRSLAKDAMNLKLLDLVKNSPPKLVIFSLFTNQFDPAVVNELRKFTTTMCFFHDDTWRVEYSRYWAGQFDYFTTPDFYGVVKYKELGLTQAIYFPFGCNEKIFRKLNIPKKYDVSFVGGWHPYRQWLFDKIRRAGINISAFGYGWPSGEINQEDMVKVFNQSRINLNLSNSGSWDFRYLSSSIHAVINRIRSKKSVEQLKARMFEISGCGSFQLSYYVEGLSNSFRIDQEIAVYSDPDDLIDKIKFYLQHESVAEDIAQRALARVLSEHTFIKRFNSAFHRMGLLE